MYSIKLGDLNYDESLMQQYSQYEERVVKMLEDKNYTNKEITNVKLDSEQQLSNLKKRLGALRSTTKAAAKRTKARIQTPLKQNIA